MNLRALISLPLAATAISCSQETPTTPSQPSSPPEARAPSEVVDTSADCTAAFGTPKAGLLVINRGPLGDRIWIEQKVLAVDHGHIRSEATMLLGPSRRRSATTAFVRRDGFVALESGAADALRHNSYGPNLTSEAIQHLRPGQTLISTISEQSEFAGPAGDKQVDGPYKVTFVGCSSLAVQGRPETTKVFDVQTVSRSFNDRASEGEKESIRSTTSRFSVSERLGVILTNKDQSGSITAIQIVEPR